MYLQYLWHSISADCGPPPVVKRSTISIGNNLQGTTRMYTCDQNTVTEGETSTECQIDGSWSQTSLYCRRKSSNLYIRPVQHKMQHTNNCYKFHGQLHAEKGLTA